MEIGRLAERQHGVVSLTQLRSLGLGKSGVAKRARTRRLTRIHRGVYAVGHGRLTMHGRWMAAVLACGACAVRGLPAGRGAFTAPADPLRRLR